MVVTDVSGGIHKMDMDDMGGHWSSDQNGNPYVENKRVGIGTNTPHTQSMLDVINSQSGQSNINYAGKFKSENGLKTMQYLQ